MPTESGFRTRSTGRIARKSHICETRLAWAADHRISPGQPYIEHTEFPGGESGYATQAGRPVRMAECAACAHSVGRGHLLPARPGYLLLVDAARALDISLGTLQAWRLRRLIGGNDREISKDEIAAYLKKRAKARARLAELLAEEPNDY